MGAHALEFLACPLQLAAIPGADGEVSALAGKLLRHGETKPTRCAGDQDHAVMQVEAGQQPPRQRPRRDPSANTGGGKSETSSQGDAAGKVYQHRRGIALAGGFGLAAAGIGAGIAAWSLARRLLPSLDLHHRVVLITGSSRGLGLAMAQEFARQGAYLAICARDRGELEWARQELERMGAHVLPVVCDVTSDNDVNRMVREVIDHFGRIDVLVNNAGTISVGPLEDQRPPDYQEAMDVMFWGTVYPTLAVLPHMLARRSGRI